jgi:hypothetical protein
MKRIFLFACLLISCHAWGQRQTENIIIITTDGFRWQDLFKGMDSAIANNSKYNQGDSSYLFEKYWSNDESERRKKLMPFLWSTILSHGQLFGNRTAGSKVDNANPYWFSYPGYSEIMTGYADTAINSNSYDPNPNVTVLEFLNKQPKLKGKVAAFSAWDAFDRILNEKRSGIPVMSGFDTVAGKNLTAQQKLINKMLLDSYRPWGNEECLDVGHQVDAWLKEIWKFVQSDPQYKNKTTLLITTDHGRGDINKDEWTSHNNKIQDAHEIWFAAMGPDAPARGELKSEMQLYQQQFAQTIAKLLGYTYEAKHPIADEILYLFKMRK